MCSLKSITGKDDNCILLAIMTTMCNQPRTSFVVYFNKSSPPRVEFWSDFQLLRDYYCDLNDKIDYQAMLQIRNNYFTEKEWFYNPSFGIPIDIHLNPNKSLLDDYIGDKNNYNERMLAVSEKEDDDPPLNNDAVKIKREHWKILLGPPGYTTINCLEGISSSSLHNPIVIAEDEDKNQLLSKQQHVDLGAPPVVIIPPPPIPSFAPSIMMITNEQHLKETRKERMAAKSLQEKAEESKRLQQEQLQKKVERINKRLASENSKLQNKLKDKVTNNDNNDEKKMISLKQRLVEVLSQKEQLQLDLDKKTQQEKKSTKQQKTSNDCNDTVFHNASSSSSSHHHDAIGSDTTSNQYNPNNNNNIMNNIFTLQQQIIDKNLVNEENLRVKRRAETLEDSRTARDWQVTDSRTLFERDQHSTQLAFDRSEKKKKNEVSDELAISAQKHEQNKELLKIRLDSEKQEMESRQQFQLSIAKQVTNRSENNLMYATLQQQQMS